MTWLLLTVGAIDVVLDFAILKFPTHEPPGHPARIGAIVAGTLFLVNAAILLSAVLSRLFF